MKDDNFLTVLNFAIKAIQTGFIIVIALTLKEILKVLQHGG